DDAQNPAENLTGVLEWERNPDTIILRIDERRDQEDPAVLANAVPPCTLWGDGRLVWTVSIENENQVLEARLSDEEVRRLLWDGIIQRGFYDWRSDFIIPDGNNQTIQTITLNLYDEVFTVSRYGNWPVNGYHAILQSCLEVSSTPVLFIPTGGWLSA